MMINFVIGDKKQIMQLFFEYFGPEEYVMNILRNFTYESLTLPSLC